MMMPGRKFSLENYRYGFNGKENELEIKGDGDNYDFDNRIYDPRIARWYSLDPLQKKYPGETHYSFVSDNPTIYADFDGKDKIYTLTVIDKDGRSTTIKKVDKDFFLYKHVEISGIGNDRYYKQDLLVNTIIDLRYGIATYSQDLGKRTEISEASYDWQMVKEFLSSNSSRGKQAGGIVFTSAFASQVDGPKTDVTKGSDGSVNIDFLTAAFGALAKSGEALKFTMDDLPEWISHTKELVESYQNSLSSSTSSSSNTKRTPVVLSTPAREGPGWDYYIRDKNGNFKASGRTLGLPDSIVKGKEGDPDTTFERPYKEPLIPRTNKRK